MIGKLKSTIFEFDADKKHFHVIMATDDGEIEIKPNEEYFKNSQEKSECLKPKPPLMGDEMCHHFERAKVKEEVPKEFKRCLKFKFGSKNSDVTLQFICQDKFKVHEAALLALNQDGLPEGNWKEVKSADYTKLCSLTLPSQILKPGNNPVKTCPYPDAKQLENTNRDVNNFSL